MEQSVENATKDQLLGRVSDDADLSEKGAEALEELVRRTASEVSSGPEPLWTVSDVADRLNVSERTVYTLLDQGEIQSIRVGRQHRFEPEAIERYLRRQARSGG